ncbi:MAG: FMN-binding protein [Candidatus Falkowbacteria bacterium]|nr:FMN-binding protein [Candidatus Falkowbacteria bacterium]
MDNAKKIILSVSFIVIFVIYAFYQQSIDTKNIPKNINQSAQIPTEVAQTQKKYKDGEYVGDSVDAYYGNIQVKVIIKDGSITDVQFLSYPNDKPNSIRVNTHAMPILMHEALGIQNENVDAVSGASYTSEAFKKSLRSSLDQAKL